MSDSVVQGKMRGRFAAGYFKAAALTSIMLETRGGRLGKDHGRPAGDRRSGAELGALARRRRLGALPHRVARRWLDDAPPGSRGRPSEFIAVSRRASSKGVNILHFLGGSGRREGRPRGRADQDDHQPARPRRRRAGRRGLHRALLRFLRAAQGRMEASCAASRSTRRTASIRSTRLPAWCSSPKLLAELPGRLPAPRLPADQARLQDQDGHAAAQGAGRAGAVRARQAPGSKARSRPSIRRRWLRACRRTDSWLPKSTRSSSGRGSPVSTNSTACATVSGCRSRCWRRAATLAAPGTGTGIRALAVTRKATPTAISSRAS